MDGRVHWSFWIIGAVGLIFNLMGCANFVAQMSADALASMPEGYRMLVQNRPGWATGAFALAVFGGAIGACLLLLKKRTAVYVFVAALIGAIVTQVPLLNVAEVPDGAIIGGISQLLVMVLLIWYATYTMGKGWIS